MTLRVYLADLTHMDLGVASEAFPLNIGLIASYAKKNFGKELDITLFKYPQNLLQALNEKTPHILGCSHYTWNCNLSYYFTELAKSLNPDTLVVWGGTNYPFQAAQQEKLLRRRAKLDIHINYEGENAFSNIIERSLSVATPKKILQNPIDGCHFISPSYDSFVAGEELDRIRDLDSIPSPYVSGLMDKFFDGVLTPMIETSRGCPFACNFCNAGDEYFKAVNKFSDDYVNEEFTYIAKQAAKAGISGAILADNNFGMIPRDSKTSQLFYDLQQKYAWPHTVTTCTGKNSKERVIEATRLLGDTLSVTMSVQSMDEDVLKNIKRDNIRLEDYREISKELAEKKRTRNAEVIAPLPGETLESFFKGVADLLDTKVGRIQCHTLTMIHGTDYKDNEKFLKDYEYVTKFRIVVRSFTSIEGQPILDVEEVAVATKDMSFSDYIKMRKYMFVIELCTNCNVFEPLLRHFEQNNIKCSEWIHHIYQNLDQLPDAVNEIFKSFDLETVDELWDSEKALVEHYSKAENYRLLIEGKRGNNVVFMHRIRLYSKMANAWINEVFKLTQDFVLDQLDKSDLDRVCRELDAIQSFIIGTASDCYSPKTLDKHLSREINYDIPSWMNASKDKPLQDFAFPHTASITFFHSTENKLALSDGFKRYGTDMSSMVKLVQRLAGRAPIRSASVITHK